MASEEPALDGRLEAVGQRGAAAPSDGGGDPFPIWIDGEVVEPGRATISVLSHSLHYGSGVFEGVRSYRGRLFEAESHMARLINSAWLLGYELGYSASELTDAAEGLRRQCGVDDAYLRPFAWRGSEDIDITGSGTKPRVAIALWRWPSYYKDERGDRSVTLTRAKWTRPSPDMLPLQSKAAGLYVAATLNRQFAKDRGFSDCLVFDGDGRVVEATVANVFIVKRGALVTPPPVSCLDGVTRRCVLRLARDLGLEASEADIHWSDVAEADEIFLTGTAVEVMPVTRVDDLAYPIGPVTRALWTAYDVLVGKRTLADA